MKKSSLGCPSSARRKTGLAKDVKSWTSRAEAVTPILTKYGAQFVRAMMRAGYMEFSWPEVVATIE
jgi:hypothetical protein